MIARPDILAELTDAVVKAADYYVATRARVHDERSMRFSCEGRCRCQECRDGRADVTAALDALTEALRLRSIYA